MRLKNFKDCRELRVVQEIQKDRQVFGFKAALVRPGEDKT